jgi:signal transduction histidine kinase
MHATMSESPSPTPTPSPPTPEYVKVLEATIQELRQELERHKVNETMLNRRLERIEFMSQIAAFFALVDYAHLDALITRALQDATRFTGVERGYIFLLSPDEERLELAYEWCEPDVIAHQGILESVRVADFTDLVASLRRGDVASVQTADLPRTPDTKAMTDILDLLDIKSFINIPVIVSRRFIGYIGFDATRQPMIWTDEVQNVFMHTGNVIGSALERRRVTNELMALRDSLELTVTERTRQLEAANRELEAFSYSVSHDLRAPLRSMEGFSQALIEDYAGQLDATAHDYLSRIKAANQRANGLIDGMLQLSRLTRNPLTLTVVDLSGLAQEVAAELGQTAPERQVAWVIAPNLKMLGDAKLLRIMLANLLNNAWKFTRHTPRPQIEVGQVVIEGRPCFFVRDNGDGFDMRHSHRLFGAFQRLHATTEFEGSGIGLATVQRVINRHGGRVWAEGEKGRGATFYFSLV